MQHSKGNHFRWGWNGEWFNPPVLGGTFQTQLGSCVDGHAGFRRECINAVSDLAGQFTKPIRVGLSGGSDSQVVCLSLREAKINFQPVILRLRGPQGGIRNEFDIKLAFDFCKRFNLEPHVEDLDLRAFYRERAGKLAAEHCLTGVEVVVQLHLVEKYKSSYAFIMAGGDLVITQDQRGDVVTPFGPTPIQSHLVKYDIEGCTKFFMYSPELIASYLDNPFMKGLIAARKPVYEAYRSLTTDPPWLCWNYFIKPLFYMTEFPELVIQKKLTGFEKADDLITEGQVLMNLATERFNTQKKLVRIEELLDHVTSGRGALKVW